MVQAGISIKQIRTLIIVGTLLLSSFMIADLILLPSILHSTYLNVRLGLQIPVCILFFMSTFLPNFKKYYQYFLVTTMATLVYINFGLIYTCWDLQSFSFPYEGTIMYSLFSFFIFRLNFKFGVPFSIIIIIGFSFLLISTPIYGDRNLVNIGFVIVSLIVSLLGVYRIELTSSDNDKKTQQLLLLSQIDPLTGVLNRAEFETRFNAILAFNRRAQENICVYFIDLDYFKDYNDGYGHPEGDKIIQLQADMLKDIFQRSDDIVARYGGEEFIVVTSGSDKKTATTFANTILQQWQIQQQPHNKGKAGRYVTCSVGYYVEKAELNSTVQKLTEKADIALYQAKENGRNNAVRFKSLRN